MVFRTKRCTEPTPLVRLFTLIAVSAVSAVFVVTVFSTLAFLKAPQTKTRLSAGCCANTASLFCIGNYYLVANFSRIRADLPERSRK
jgi:hypothetical protein